MVAAEEAVDVSGAWSLTIQGRQGPRTMDLNLEQDGEELSGTLTGPQGRETPFTGSIKGAKIKFTVKFQTQRGELEIIYKGTVEGDEMSGKAQLPQAAIDWSAKKK
jgi:hypothetical protein